MHVQYFRRREAIFSGGSTMKVKGAEVEVTSLSLSSSSNLSSSKNSWRGSTGSAPPNRWIRTWRACCCCWSTSRSCFAVADLQCLVLCLGCFSFSSIYIVGSFFCLAVFFLKKNVVYIEQPVRSSPSFTSSAFDIDPQLSFQQS